MYSGNRNIIVIILSLALLAAGTAYFTYQAVFLKGGDPWEHIPAHSGMVIRINGDEFFGNKGITSSDLLRNMEKHQAYRMPVKTLLFLDSLFNSHPEEYSRLEQSEMLIALFPSGNSWSGAFIAGLAGRSDINLWKFILGHYGKLVAQEKKDRFQLKTEGTSFNILLNNNILIVTPDNPTFNQIISPQDQSQEWDILLSYRDQARNRSPISLFLDQQMIRSLMMSPGKLPGNNDTIRSGPAWSMLDVIIKRDEAIISGYLPSGISWSFGQSVSLHDFPTGIPAEIHASAGLGTYEFPVVEPDSNNVNWKPAFSLSGIFQNKKLSGVLLEPIDSMTMLWMTRQEFNNEAGISAKFLARTNQILIESFPGMDTSHMELIKAGKVLIAGPSTELLRQYSSDVLSNRTIDRFKWFSDVREDLPDSASLWGYASLSPNSQEGDEKEPSIEPRITWAVLPGEKPLITASLRTVSEARQEAPATTGLASSTEITHRPFPVWDHRNERYNVLVFDNENTARLFSPKGKVIWEYSMDDTPLGDVEVVDAYRNGKFQYLFNTENFIYMIDLDGRDVEGFPREIEAGASNGLVALDYDGRKDYRILVACNDRVIRNYDINGKTVSGWKEPEMKSLVKVPIQHIAMYGKDYIIIPDEGGEVIMTDRRGDVRVRIRRSFTNSPRTAFFMQRIDGETRIITTDVSGRIRALQRNGRLKTINLGNFNADHLFVYAPFSSGRESDYIFFDEGRLQVYNKSGELSMDINTEVKTNLAPDVVTIGSNRLIAIVDKESSNIHLYRDGLDEPYRVIRGSFIPTVIDLDQDLRPDFLTAYDNQLVMRAIED